MKSWNRFTASDWYGLTVGEWSTLVADFTYDPNTWLIVAADVFASHATHDIFVPSSTFAVYTPRATQDAFDPAAGPKTVFMPRTTLHVEQGAL